MSKRECEYSRKYHVFYSLRSIKAQDIQYIHFLHVVIEDFAFA